MRVLLVAAVMSLGGCAAIFSSGTETVQVWSNVPGAQVTVDGTPAGVTPTEISVDNHRNHTIVVTGPHGQASSCRLTTSVGAGWVILDLLAGLVPIIIDAATGAWSTLDDDRCIVHLPPGPAAGAPGAY